MATHGPILLVDDDEDIRETLADYLEGEGYDVLPAVNGLDALEILKGRGTACVVLLDLMMPIMDGYTFRKEQKKLPAIADVPVVVITAGSKVDNDEFDPAEIHYKPLDLDRLMASLQHYC